MRRPAFQYATMIVGLLAALAIIFSQAFSSDAYSTTKSAKAETSQQSTTDDSDAEEKNSPDFSISATSFQPSAQFGFVQQAICLFEIVFTSDQPETDIELETLPLGTFFSTILTVLISPNAP